MKKFTLIIMTIMIWLLSYSQGNSNYYYDGYNAHFWVNDSTSAIMIIKNMNNYTQISNRLKNIFVSTNDEIIENDEENNIIINSSSLNTIDIDSLISAISVKSDDIEFFSFSKVINNYHYWLRNEVYVKFTDTAKYSQYVQGLLIAYGANSSNYEGFNEYRITFGNEMQMMQFANRLKDSLWVEYSTPDLYCEISDNSYTTNDPNINGYPGYYNGSNSTINISKAWDFLDKGMSQIGSSNIKVAVLDHGIDAHVDFYTNLGVTKIADSWSPIGNNSGSNNDNDGHGQNCSGIIISTHNSIGTAGIAPDCRISAIRITNRLGNFCSNSNIRNAIRHSWQNCNAAVLNNSWGFSNNLNHPIITNAINEALSNGRNGKGCVVVFASGNDNVNHVSYPSSLNGVISVGSVKNNLNRAVYTFGGSNYGDCLSVVAFGDGIPTTSLNNGYTNSFYGTSAASPQVSGVAALMLSANPNLTTNQVKAIIEQTAQKIHYNTSYIYTNGPSLHPNGEWNNEVGYGLIDAHKAVMEAYFYNHAIEGDYNISSCNEYTYSLSSTIPNGTSLTWEISNNMEIVSGQGTSNIVVRPIGNGGGWIKAKLEHENNIVTKSKNVLISPGASTYYNNYTTNGTITFTSDLVIAGTFTISNGSIVTISSTAYCSPTARIIIRPGGKLIVNGGTLTNLCPGKMWDGIYVVGNKNECQIATEQGTLEVKNGSVIENAKCAIHNWDSINANHSGGIIKVSGHSILRNNGRAAEFVEYTNTTPNGTQINDVSFFKFCDFIIDDNNLFSSNGITFQSFVKMNGVKGISFTACNFRNGCSSVNIQQYAIESIGSAFSVGPNCSGVYDPSTCQCVGTLTKSRFARMGRGIKASNGGSTYSFSVDRTIFDTCYWSVAVWAVNNYAVTRSDFDETSYPTFSQSTTTAGVNTKYSSGFTIEENNFYTHYSSNNNARLDNGIYCSESGRDYNIIYRNTFEGFYYALMTGNNANTGLQFQCNDFKRNFSRDAYLESASSVQGSSAKSAGNKFTVQTPYNITSDHAITYFHSGGQYSSNIYYPSLVSNNVTRTAFATFNDCNSTLCDFNVIIGPIVGKSAPSNDFVTLYDSLQQIYESRLADYNAAGYDFLLENFEEGDADIVATARLMQDTLISIRRAMAEIANRNIDAILQDTLFFDREALNGWYNRINTQTAKYSLVNSYFEVGEYALARQELASIPQRFALTTDELAEYDNFCQYQSLRESVYSSGRNYAQLTEDEIAELQTIAERNTGVSSAYANSVLCFFYGICMDEEIDADYYFNMDAPLNSKRTTAVTESETEQFAIYVYPNPANEELNILLNSLPEGKTTIDFHDVTGRLVLSEEIKGNNTSINISSLKQGVYMYRIINGDNIIARDRIVKE